MLTHQATCLYLMLTYALYLKRINLVLAQVFCSPANTFNKINMLAKWSMLFFRSCA